MMLGHHGHQAHLITEDMRNVALKQTQDHLKKLDGIRKEIGLPVEQMELVASIYLGFIGTELDKVVHTHERAQRKKMREHQKKMIDQNPMYASSSMGYAGIAPSPMGLGAFEGIDLDDDDEI